MLQYSPRIITDSLVMCVDPSQNKSYPTTDLPVKDGLIMWMDAADDTTFSYSSGTTVSQWRDKSGFNYHMVPVSAGPTRNAFLNSKKVIACTTSQQIGNSSINLVSSPYTIFCVTRLTGTTNSRVLSNAYTGATGTNWLLGHWGGWVNQYYAEGWVTGPYSPGSVANTAWNVFMGDWSGASTDLANLYTNGTAITTNSNGANAGPLGLGINVSSEVSTCEAAEVIVFNRVLTAVERRLINTYLGQKWGILNTDRSLFDLSNYDDNALLGEGTTANMPFLDYYNNGSFKFDGTNDYMSVTRTLSVPMTICGFIKYVDQSKSYNTFINGYPHNTIAISLNRNGAGNIQIFLGNGSAWVGAPAISYTSLSVDTWYHITFTCDGTTSTLYINGVNVATSNIIPSGFGSYFYLGHLTGGVSSSEYLKGNLAGVQLYTTALTSTQVLQNYEAQKSRYAVSLVQQGLVLNLDAGNPYSYAGAGTTWYDTSGNSINAVASGTSYYTKLNGGLLNFPGNSSYYNTSAVSTLNLGASSFSMESWVYLDAGTSSDNAYRGIISLGLDASNYVYISKWRSGLYSGLYVQYVAAGSTITGVYQGNDYNPVSRWTHVVATKSSNVLSFYVNGVLYYSMSDLNTTFTGNSSVYIAQAHGGVNSLNGYIGESRIYNIALSAAQVLQNYNATKGRFGL